MQVLPMDPVDPTVLAPTATLHGVSGTGPSHDRVPGRGVVGVVYGQRAAREFGRDAGVDEEPVARGLEKDGMSRGKLFMVRGWLDVEDGTQLMWSWWGRVRPG
jgi:hypothetical protein